MKDVVIVSGVRLPVGTFGGSLKDKTQIEMGGMVVKEAVRRAGIKPENVDEVIVGMVNEFAQNAFVGRAVALQAGLPLGTTAYSVNRQCASGLQAIQEAWMEINLGLADVCVCAGVESTSRLPYYSPDTRWGHKLGAVTFEDAVYDALVWPLNGNHNGITAENVAKKYNVTREEQDQYAAMSHKRACDAIKAGRYKDEILPVELKGRKGVITVFDTDEGPREDCTYEKLSKLKPCFVTDGTGTVTAANASSLNDGAAAVVVMSKEKAEELGIKPIMKIEGFAVSAMEPELMGYAPKLSSEKLAEKLDIDLKSIDMVEINEAFASQTVAVARDLELDMNKVNMYGGGISIGHPLGATGVILAVKVLYEFMNTSRKDAMIAMCIGGGQGVSMYFTKCE